MLIIIILIFAIIAYFLSCSREHFLPEAIFPYDPKEKPIFSQNNTQPMALISSPNNTQSISKNVMNKVTSDINVVSNSTGVPTDYIPNVPVVYSPNIQTNYSPDVLMNNTSIKPTTNVSPLNKIKFDSIQTNDVKKEDVSDYMISPTVQEVIEDEKKKEDIVYAYKSDRIKYVPCDLEGIVYKGYNVDSFTSYGNSNIDGKIPLDNKAEIKPQGINYLFV